jgi:hypothetical protein
MWERMEKKLVLADDDPQALVYVGRGEVDAGFYILPTQKLHNPAL